MDDLSRFHSQVKHHLFDILDGRYPNPNELLIEYMCPFKGVTVKLEDNTQLRKLVYPHLNNFGIMLEVWVTLVSTVDKLVPISRDLLNHRQSLLSQIPTSIQSPETLRMANFEEIHKGDSLIRYMVVMIKLNFSGRKKYILDDGIKYMFNLFELEDELQYERDLALELLTADASKLIISYMCPDEGVLVELKDNLQLKMLIRDHLHHNYGTILELWVMVVLPDHLQPVSVDHLLKKQRREYAKMQASINSTPCSNMDSTLTDQKKASTASDYDTQDDHR